ncbi:amidohydrolase [Pseudoxanthomonas broegbernensis]|uniref:Amidohydrolase n=1 Tax=Pseudoxanthomonas broegbernensis TaxID=83619 RepID=A0A7V8GPS0_9GAMM|nr:amidohydrolase family protein [Pseudoxanthomonas broegbernensis]KAF1687907.1 amidohydrolase [Pseudoxanthomonas broegbernensis]MBB6064906.1 L-fuconolactonase [Pseudoxanthomonas broegbernensis]
MNRLDAHQHYWRPARGDYGWLTPAMDVLYRNWQPSDLRPLLAAHDVAATVLVQAAPTEAETEELLRIASEEPTVAGVVGWVDLEAGDAPARIGALAARAGGRLLGLRPMLQDLDDPDWVARPALDAAFEAMAAHGLVLDILARPSHLAAARTRLLRHPHLRAVLDHCGKPDIAAGEDPAWRAGVAALARDTGAYCKLSGLLTQAPAGAGIEDLSPWVEHVFACFGPQRVLWGSDWPVLNLAGDYAGWLRLATGLVRRHAPGAERAVFAGNARALYRLEERERA